MWSRGIPLILIFSAIVVPSLGAVERELRGGTIVKHAPKSRNDSRCIACVLHLYCLLLVSSLLGAAESLTLAPAGSAENFLPRDTRFLQFLRGSWFHHYQYVTHARVAVCGVSPRKREIPTLKVQRGTGEQLPHQRVRLCAV